MHRLPFTKYSTYSISSIVFSYFHENMKFEKYVQTNTWYSILHTQHDRQSLHCCIQSLSSYNRPNPFVYASLSWPTVRNFPLFCFIACKNSANKGKIAIFSQFDFKDDFFLSLRVSSDLCSNLRNEKKNYCLTTKTKQNTTNCVQVFYESQLLQFFS